MSKKSRTTGTPAPAKRTPVARKYHSRHEREATINRAVWIVSGVLAALIVLILGAAVLVELVITPNQAVAAVAGTSITTRDFQTRVRYERWRQGLDLAYIYQNFGEQWLSGQGAPYAQQYQALQIPTILGQQVLEEMTNQLVIQKYADANGIKVSQADIDAEVYRFFQYEPTPTTPTPTVTPSLTPTPLVSPTPTPTSTPTPVPSMTPTLVPPTPSPFPTGLPTPTPGPTEQFQNYQKNSQDYYTRAAKAAGISEAEFRQIFVERALATKVRKAIVGEPPEKQEQSKVRHILLKTKAEADDVLKALQQGESFSALAQALSQDNQSGGGSAAKGGELGWQGRSVYVPEFEDAVWNAKVGDILGPIDTSKNGSQYGFHIIQVEAREMRVLTESEKTQVQDKQFQDWLNKQRDEKKVETFPYWVERVPSTPTLTELGLPSTLGTNLGP